MSDNNRSYCITLNNPGAPGHLTEEQVIEKLSADNVKYGVFGREGRGEGHTYHLQIFVIYNNGKRWGPVVTEWSGAHVERKSVKSKNIDAANYCKKEGDWEEFGTLPSEQGSRSDLQLAVAWSALFREENGRPPTSPEVAREHPSVYIKYPRFTRCLQAQTTARRLVFTEELKEWQSELLEILLGEADDRKILFYVDRDGGQGKTWFCKYMLTKHFDKVNVVEGGRDVDIAFMLDPTKHIVLFNLPRNGLEYLPIRVLERIKDQMVASTKYASVLKIFEKKTHVVVFTNEMYENYTEDGKIKLSEDRVVIKELS